jgi:hypothetical protein
MEAYSFKSSKCRGISIITVIFLLTYLFMYLLLQSDWTLHRAHVWPLMLVFSLHSLSLFVHSIVTKSTAMGPYLFEKDTDGNYYNFVTSFWIFAFIVGVILTIFEIKGLIPLQNT